MTWAIAGREFGGGMLLVLLGGLASAQTPTIHVLLAGDTNDGSIGASVKMDLDYMYRVFYCFVPQRQLRITTLQGDRLSRQAILDGFANVGPSDALLFYWSGHGAHDARGHYLNMPAAGVLHRAEIIERMQQKGARLVVVLSDSCNKFAEKPVPRPTVPYIRPPSQISPLFEALFVAHRGLVDINAASEDELAWGTSLGGLFTVALAYPQLPGTDAPPGVTPGFFWKHANQRISWAALVPEVRQQVKEYFEQLGNDGSQTVRVWTLPRPVHPPPLRVTSLQAGDLLVSINGQGIGCAGCFLRAVASSPGEMKLTVRRNDQLLHLQAALRNPGEQRFGVQANDRGGDGLRVTTVVPGSPASQSRILRQKNVVSLKPGDLILSINGQRVDSLQTYWNAVKASPQTLRLTVLPQGGNAPLSLIAALRNGNRSRLGLLADDNRGRGVRIVEVWQGYPGAAVELDD